MVLWTPSWFSGVPWLQVYVGFSLTVEAFEQYLNYRQLQRYYLKKPPVQLRSKVSDDEFAKTNAYNRDKITFSIVSSAVQTGVSILSTCCFFGPWSWRTAGALVGGKSEYTQLLVFLGINKLFSECIATPLDVYSDFEIEEKHGFNKKSVGLFIKDKLVYLGLTALIGAPITCAATWLIRRGGKNFYLWLWGFSVITTLGLTILYPSFIAPLFNKFEVLEDKELRSKINTLAAKLNFPLREVYQMDGSKRSSHSNAYFYGLWRWKRIVIYDTLLHLPHDQVLAVLAHELGHWKKNHFTYRLAIIYLNLFATFYLYGLVMDNDHLYRSFGYENARAPIIGLILFGHILAPVNTVLGVISTLLSRKHEFEADEFACQLNYGEELREALLTIHTDNKSTLDPDPWFSWWHYSHPPLLERLAAVDTLVRKAGDSTCRKKQCCKIDGEQLQAAVARGAAGVAAADRGRPRSTVARPQAGEAED